MNSLAIVITFTRGAWVCYIISLFLILISKKYRKIIYISIPAALIFIKPVINYILTRGRSNVSFLTNESSMARILSVFTGVEILKKYPFGVGGGSFGEYYKLFAVKGYLLLPSSFRAKMSVPTYALENAHNLWIQLAVEFGIFGFVIVLLIFINRIKVCFTNYKCNRAYFVAILNYIIYSVSTGVELNHKVIITQTIVVWIVFALLDLKYDKCNNIK